MSSGQSTILPPCFGSMRNDLATTPPCADPENFPSSHQLFIFVHKHPNAFLDCRESIMFSTFPLTMLL